VSVTVRVSARLSLDTRAAPRALLARLARRLTIPNPERRKRARAGLDPAGVDPFARLYHRAGHLLIMPRGAVGIVRSEARRHGVELSWQPAVVSRSAGAVDADSLPLTLRPYQRDAVSALRRGVQGYIVAPCGAGKTVIGASALVLTGEPSLILVHTRDLLSQWTGLLRSWGLTVRTVAGGRRRCLRDPLSVQSGRPEFAVATVQTLERAGESAQTLISSAGAVLLDEAHHAPASTFRRVIESAPARYRWGVTATPDRDDGWGVLLPLLLGPQLWSVSVPELIDGGWLLRPRLVAVDSGADVTAERFIDPRTGRLDMTGAVTALTVDPSRVALLVELSLQLVRDGRTLLVLVPRRAAAHELSRLLTARGVLAMPVTSDVPGGLRAARIDQLRRGVLRVLVATQLADEGLDVRSLDAMIIASTGRAAGRAVQRIGRAMRVADGKRTPIVVDIVDPIPFIGQWTARRRAYRERVGVCASRRSRRETAAQKLAAVLAEERELAGQHDAR